MRSAIGNTEFSRRTAKWPVSLRQFSGLIVLFAALSAGSTLLQAGWEKLGDPAWTGQQSGLAMKGFLAGAKFKATQTPTNPYPDVLPFWNSLNQNLFAQHLQLFGWLVILGEILLPIAVLTLLCVRFAGSRGLLTGIAALAVGLNLLYLHEGSAGDNAPMIVLWLTVLFAAAQVPEAAQAYAIDLSSLVRRGVARRERVTVTLPGRWSVAAAALLLALESFLLHSLLTVLLLAAATVSLAFVLRSLERALASLQARPAAVESLETRVGSIIVPE